MIVFFIAFRIRILLKRYSGCFPSNAQLTRLNSFTLKTSSYLKLPGALQSLS